MIKKHNIMLFFLEELAFLETYDIMFIVLVLKISKEDL